MVGSGIRQAGRRVHLAPLLLEVPSHRIAAIELSYMHEYEMVEPICCLLVEWDSDSIFHDELARGTGQTISTVVKQIRKLIICVQRSVLKKRHLSV